MAARVILFCFFLCFVDRASRNICVIKTNLMQYLSSVYFISQPLHVSGIFVAHHQEVYCTYTTIGTFCAEKRNVINFKHPSFYNTELTFK
jgi:hypothetical protein